MTRDEIKKIREKLEKKFGEFTEETGYLISIGTIRFDENTFRARIEGIKTNSGVSVPDGMNPRDAKFALEFDVMTPMDKKYHNIPKDTNIGDTFKSGSRTFTLIGVKTKNHSYPIIGRGSRGGTYKFSSNNIRWT